jgi:hypothetical protein
MPRGSDFEARWTEGAWAEARILEALNVVPELISVQFGITEGTAYWSSKEMAARDLPDQTQHGKRPDILVFQRAALSNREIAELDTQLKKEQCLLRLLSPAPSLSSS